MNSIQVWVVISLIVAFILVYRGVKHMARRPRCGCLLYSRIHKLERKSGNLFTTYTFTYCPQCDAWEEEKRYIKIFSPSKLRWRRMFFPWQFRNIAEYQRKVGTFVRPMPHTSSRPALR